MSLNRTTFSIALASVLLVVSAVVAADSDQDVLGRAKELYRTAAYDEALGMLNSIPSSSPSVDPLEVSEYRVFCLVALDRKDDAKNAIAEMVTADPFYHLSEAQTSPRVRALFDEVRHAVLPTAVQHAYAEAKAAFDRKDPAATARFDVVLKLLEDPDVARTDEFDDLKVVVRGFRDLSTARAAAAVPVPAVKGGAAPAAEPVKPPSAAEKQATPPVAIPPVYRDGALDLTPPVAISQRMPTAVLPGRRLWTGAVELLIDETGGVQSARMAVPIHPAYDSQLLKAVREWKYRPATKNGVPVRYAKIISIRVDTR